MIADRSSMTRELDTLIHQQIHIFKQDAKITEPELNQYTERSQRIRVLCRTLNQGGFRRTSADKQCD